MISEKRPRVAGRLELRLDPALIQLPRLSTVEAVRRAFSLVRASLYPLAGSPSPHPFPKSKHVGMCVWGAREGGVAPKHLVRVVLIVQRSR